MTVQLFFFFSSRRRHTRLQGDWSSDVCSSDLPGRAPRAPARTPLALIPASTGKPRPAAQRPGCAPRHDASSERSEEHTSELQSPCNLVCRLLLEKKKSQALGIEKE